MYRALVRDFGERFLRLASEHQELSTADGLTLLPKGKQRALYVSTKLEAAAETGGGSEKFRNLVISRVWQRILDLVNLSFTVLCFECSRNYVLL